MKTREVQKNIYFYFIDYVKAFDCVDHNKLWKILKDMGIPDHLTCLLRNLYTCQEVTVRTRHGTMDWFQMGEGVHQGHVLSPLMYSFPSLEPVYCSMSGSNFCFLTCIQVSQEAGKVVWYSHLFKHFPICCDLYKGFSVVSEAEADVFFKNSLAFFMIQRMFTI